MIAEDFAADGLMLWRSDKPWADPLARGCLRHRPATNSAGADPIAIGALLPCPSALTHLTDALGFGLGQVKHDQEGQQQQCQNPEGERGTL